MKLTKTTVEVEGRDVWFSPRLPYFSFLVQLSPSADFLLLQRSEMMYTCQAACLYTVCLS